MSLRDFFFFRFLGVVIIVNYTTYFGRFFPKRSGEFFFSVVVLLLLLLLWRGGLIVRNNAAQAEKREKKTGKIKTARGAREFLLPTGAREMIDFSQYSADGRTRDARMDQLGRLTAWLRRTEV